MSTTDLPTGYRWATLGELAVWQTIQGARLVQRTTDDADQPLVVPRADVAVPDGLVAEVVYRLVRTDGGHIIESSTTQRRIPDPRVPADQEDGHG
jgi:hypothetical protein